VHKFMIFIIQTLSRLLCIVILIFLSSVICSIQHPVQQYNRVEHSLSVVNLDTSFIHRKHINVYPLKQPAQLCTWQFVNLLLIFST